MSATPLLLVLLLEMLLDARQRGFDPALHQLIAVAAQQSASGHDAHVEACFREDLTGLGQQRPRPRGFHEESPMRLRVVYLEGKLLTVNYFDDSAASAPANQTMLVGADELRTNCPWFSGSPRAAGVFGTEATHSFEVADRSPHL